MNTINSTKSISMKVSNHYQYFTLEVENFEKLEAFLLNTKDEGNAESTLIEVMDEVLETAIDNDESLETLSGYEVIAYEDKADAATYQQLEVHFKTSLENEVIEIHFK